MSLRVRASGAAALVATAASLTSPARADDAKRDASTTTTTTTTTTPAGTTSTTVTQPTTLDRFAPYPPPSPKTIGVADMGYDYAEPQYYPSFAWMIFQLVPSPEVAFGRIKQIPIGEGTAKEEVESAFGLRWQITPALWSWGMNRRLSRWRWFVVDPIARNSGSIELDTSFEYIWGHVDRAIVRPGVRATFPLVQRGEYLSFSIGTSTYAYDRVPRVAYDGGIYFLYGILGAQITVAPAHNPLTTIATFRIRYF